MKKGFTLVEVLSIITILGIIVLLVLPKISDSNKEKKQKEYDKLVEVIENAAKSYLSKHNDFSYVSINKLISDEYLTTNIINPFTNERIDGCIKKSVVNNVNKYLLESPCNNAVQLTIDLNHGEVSLNQEGTYYEGEIINLITPVNGIYEFSNWSIKSGNSTISGNILTIGTTNTEIKANYITPNVTVTLNANGGTVNPATKGIRYLEEYGNLPIPTKSDYSFIGWYTQLNGGNKIISTSTVDTLEEHTLYAHWVKTEKVYAFTGEEQTFDTEVEGYYKLEVWGAQGGVYSGSNGNGAYSYNGGYGGYSTGILHLDAGDDLFIVVGGQGSVGYTGTGGYNGGGNSSGDHSNGNWYDFSNVGSGGATHIAKRSGLLTTFESDYESELIMVAGGGATNSSPGSSGGGGYRGIGSNPGTQTTGTFGKGGNGSGYRAFGGGGGFHGGAVNGGGGSGYIGYTPLFNKHMYGYAATYSSVTSHRTLTGTCYNNVATADCAKRGTGYAKITFVGQERPPEEFFTEMIFDYKAEEEVYTIIRSGLYKIRVWGAHAGTFSGSTGNGPYSYNGGYGGYAEGKIRLNARDKLYINVGGMGAANYVAAGGYNGGGNSSGDHSNGNWYDFYNIGAGGATSVAKRSGLLITFESDYEENLIIVAGGGGASENPTSSSGGGYSGVGTNPGTQTTGTFGKGANGSGYKVYGGGGGFHGGGVNGGGGSGYIGYSNLTDKHMYCFNCSTSTDANTYTISNGTSSCVNATATDDCAKSGHGYAILTFIEE